MKTNVKRTLFGAFTAGVILAGYAIAQAPERNHIMASGGSWVNLQLAASSIERGVKYPSVIHLKGNVEIKMKGVKLWAQEADFHEGSGEIEARGNVRIIPYPAVEAPSR